MITWLNRNTGLSSSIMIPAVPFIFEHPAPCLRYRCVRPCVSCRSCPCLTACQGSPKRFSVEPLEFAVESCNGFRRRCHRHCSTNSFSHKHEECVTKGYPTNVQAVGCCRVWAFVAVNIDHPAVDRASPITYLLPRVRSESYDEQAQAVEQAYMRVTIVVCIPLNLRLADQRPTF